MHQRDTMTDKHPKRPRDPNQLAKSIVDLATGEHKAERVLSPTEHRASKAGKKGGPARAKTLSPEQRAKIASVAAQARWKKD
jgi:hypothetical protein